MTSRFWADVSIRSARFELRPITESDVTERYLSWFSGRGADNITMHPASIDDLRAYVRSRADRPDILFLAIREAEGGQHIGNIKFEPINSVLGGAIVGIFVGDETWRGRGVASEIIQASADWLQETLALRHLWLGVAEENLAAQRAYEKAGFVIAQCPLIQARPGLQTMALALPSQKRT